MKIKITGFRKTPVDWPEAWRHNFAMFANIINATAYYTVPVVLIMDFSVVPYRKFNQDDLAKEIKNTDPTLQIESIEEI